MIKESFSAKRTVKSQKIDSELIVVGGGMSGVCAAISAARLGSKVVLVQDRPVLGGNASSEIRLWILGATSHMGNNNRWAREGGIIDEILVENTYRNPEGNTLILDSILLEKVVNESNIQLLLNTSVYEIEKEGENRIKRVIGFCSQNSTKYEINGQFFIDASGDGILSFLAGVPFRMGAESTEEFGERFAPTKEYGELLGHTIYFYSKDTGVPVKYTPPAFALTDITKIPRFKSFNAADFGCKLWWIEYGGRLDTIHDTESIKWELWKVVYGVWDYIKNSGKFPESENLTLEWVGTIPGKRESRRFEGEYMLKQQDIIEQKFHWDAVAFGGWAIDLHPADGVFSEKPGCNQYHSKGIYSIPFRCFYNNLVENLFFTGRLISASHIAFGSTRVMATCAYGAQAAGVASAMAIKGKLNTRNFESAEVITKLQSLLLKYGHHIPGIGEVDEEDLMKVAKIKASSELSLSHIPSNEVWTKLVYSSAQMLPVKAGKLPDLFIKVKAEKDTTLEIQARISKRVYNHTPEVTVELIKIPLSEGINDVFIPFSTVINEAQYVYICFMANPLVEVESSGKRMTGLLTVFNKTNKAVNNTGKQVPPPNSGFDSFEFWCPHRRPDGYNFAMKLSHPLRLFGVENLVNGINRPVNKPNAWVAEFDDKTPTLIVEWIEDQAIKKIKLAFDTDFDHPMESSLMGHPETRMPFCIKNYKVMDDRGNVISEIKENYKSLNIIDLPGNHLTRKLIFQFEPPSPDVPVALYGISVY